MPANQAFKTLFSKQMTIINGGQEDQNVVVTSWEIQLISSLFSKHGIIKKKVSRNNLMSKCHDTSVSTTEIQLSIKVSVLSSFFLTQN